MLEIAGRAAQVLVALAGAYLVVLWFALIVWTFRDIEGRSRSVFTQVFSTLLSVLFFVPGVLLYLLLRPKETLDEAFQRSLEEEYLLQDLEELPHCPSCHRYVEDAFILCPHCHVQLREPCGNCEKLVDLRWPLCPYCGVVQSDQPSSGERVEPPAARWIAPGLRRRRVADGATRPRPAALDEERDEVAAAIATPDPGRYLRPVDDDTSTLAASLASGVRSFVRPLDRFLGRNGSDAAGEEYVPVAEMPRLDTGYQPDGVDPGRNGHGTGGGSSNGSGIDQPEPVVVARHRFATNGQTLHHERRDDGGDGYRNRIGPNGTGSEPVVPFPSEVDLSGQVDEPVGITWPRRDRDRES